MITITHPNGMTGNLMPEDVFVARDDVGSELGHGYVVMSFMPHLYPDCPVNIYFSLESQPAARCMLFGSLVARARQLRDSYLQYRARVYTTVHPGDTQLQHFYLECGLQMDDAEDILNLEIPAGDGRIPMSCSVVQAPLNTPEEQNAFAARMAENDLGFMTGDYLRGLMRQPHFLALGLYQNSALIGEILMAGAGDNCDLVGIYIRPECRNQGMARALLHRSMAVMAAEGVTHVTGRAMRRSQPQVRLMRDFSCTVLGTSSLYPGLYL